MKFLNGSLKNVKVLLTSGLLGALLLGPTAHAGQGANGQNFSPVTDSSKYFNVYGSQTLQQWQFHTGIYGNYAYHPVELGLAGERVGGVIDHLVMLDAVGSLGITDWLQIGVNVPFAAYTSFFDPDNFDANNQQVGPEEHPIGLGDIRVEAKFRLLNDFEHPVGIAIRPYVTFPTGDNAKFLGDDGFRVGGDVIVDAHVGDKFSVALNAGYVMQESERPALLNVELDDKFTYGLGMNYKALSWMDLVAQAYGSTVIDDFFGNQAEAPIEVLGGFRFYPGEGWQLDAFGGVGMTYGFGAPDFRAGLGVSYTSPREVEIVEAPPQITVVPTQIKITQRIHFQFDKDIIRAVSFRTLDAVVDVMKSQPDIRKLEIQGHTDSIGSDAYNQNLSERRAKSVITYLVEHGVESDRLVARGYGESMPIDTNDTELGRARNRRTEFVILERANPAPAEAAPVTP